MQCSSCLGVTMDSIVDEPKVGQYSVIEAAIHNEKWDFEDFNLQHLGLNIIRLEQVPST